MLVQGECLVGGGRKVETIVCHALSTPASCCLACQKGEERREDKRERGERWGRGGRRGVEGFWLVMSDCLAANGLNWATTKWKQQSALLLLLLLLFWYIRWVTVVPPPLSLSLSPVEPARACSSRAVPFPLFIILAIGNVLPTLQPARSPRLCFNFVWCITLPPIGQPSPSPTAHSSSADTCKCRVYSIANISLKFYSAFAGHTHFYADLCNSVCKQ